MKKNLLALLSILMIASFVLVACGGGAAAPAAGAKVKIGLSFSDFATER